MNSAVRTVIDTAVLLVLSLTCPAEAQSLPQSFVPANDMPLFSGQDGDWDVLIRERGWIMQEHGTWKLWYTGYDPEKTPSLRLLGYATSQDGLHWRRHSGNPLISDLWVEDMMVVRDGATLYMFAEGAEDQAQLLRSNDGIAWTRMGTLDIRLQNGRPIPPGPFGTPVAMKDVRGWWLFYERRDQGVWLAHSADMKVWTNVQDEPVINPGPDYDSQMMAMNQLFRLGDRYVAVLHGSSDDRKPRRWVTYLAESDDLLTWKKATAPLTAPELNRSSGMLLQTEAGWRLFTTHARLDLYLPAE